MIDVLGVLLNIDMQSFQRPDGSDGAESFSTPTPPAPAPSTSTPHPTPAPVPTPAPAASSSAAEDVAMDEEDEEEDEEKKAKEQALQQKQIGNDAYKKRDFDAAAAAFEKAWDLWPKDVSFLTNLSGKNS